jgi:hypothetical protein
MATPDVINLEYAGDPEGIFTHECAHGDCALCLDRDGKLCECGCHLRLWQRHDALTATATKAALA